MTQMNSLTTWSCCCDSWTDLSHLLSRCSESPELLNYQRAGTIPIRGMVESHKRATLLLVRDKGALTSLFLCASGSSATALGLVSLITQRQSRGSQKIVDELRHLVRAVKFCTVPVVHFLPHHGQAPKRYYVVTQAELCCHSKRKSRQYHVERAQKVTLRVSKSKRAN